MPENSPYFTNITNNRSIEQWDEDEQAQLEGRQLISLESQASDEETVLQFITENFATFLQNLKHLKSKDQDLLLEYYLLGIRQADLATVHRSTQTVMSFQLRAAVKTLLAVILFGGQNPDANMIAPILDRQGFLHPLIKNLEHNPVPTDLAVLIEEYFVCRSFGEVAAHHKLHRPAVRRMMSKVNEALRGAKGRREQALGWWLWSLMAKASPSGTGYSKRQIKRMGDISLVLPDVCGQCRINLKSKGFKQMFISKANI